MTWLCRHTCCQTKCDWLTRFSLPFPRIPCCSLLEQMQSDLQAGKFVYKAPWVQEGSKTGHSGASSLAAFLTPGVLDERRSTATPTLVRGSGRLLPACMMAAFCAEF